ncbi:MAG: sulfurtransferase TusA family protein [Nitrososphaerota archaeon]|nr:sulfurtransferase TusA family protein [Nitrososphaerota archaeon]
MSAKRPSLTLDVRGEMCPIPVLKTSKAIERVSVGDILEVLATDPASKPDLEAWSRMTGHKIMEFSTEGSSPTVYRFLIQRTK